MGLDISYFSNALIVKDDGYCANNSHFKYQLGTLLPNRFYGTSTKSVYGHFSVGSYGGYNHWREQLLKYVGYSSLDDISSDFDPTINIRKQKLNQIKLNNNEIIDIDSSNKQIINKFYEILYFTDCDGLIGPDISKKLYKDFCDFDEKAKEFDLYFYDLYSKFKEAFRVASDHGLVSFH